jgi:uncharacterized heparinase superfamily protein
VDAPRLPSPSSAALAVQAAGEGARRFLEREWFGTLFHRMAIAGPKPEGLAANPRDLRPVEPERGRKILGGVFDLAGTQLPVGPQGDPFDRPSPDRRFAVALHRMDWLGDLLAAAGLGGSLTAIGILAPDVPALAAAAATQWTASFNPRPVTVGDLAALYEAAR